jgi:hypothetical protein
MKLARVYRALMLVGSGAMLFQTTTGCEDTTLLSALETIAKLAIVFALEIGLT